MNDPSTNDLSVIDRAHLFHPSTAAGSHARGESPNRIITGGEGVHIIDRDGQRSLDAFAGLYCVNVGYGRPEIATAIADQAHALAYYHAYAGHASEPAIELAGMIAERAPPGLDHVYFGLSGSDANETNIKLIWFYNNILGRPQKKKIISRWRGYHGSGLMTGSLTGLELFHNAFDLPLGPVLHTVAPYYFRRENRELDEASFAQYCADELERLILSEGPDTVAAFIGEPVLGTGGIVPPPADYWQRIQAVLQKYEVLLVADEVVTGFGRLGSMFGSAHYGMRPDLVTIAKGLTSAYAPLSGVIVADGVWKVVQQGCDEMGPIGHGWTYSAHPLCAAAGVANLKLIDRLGVVDNAREVGAYLLRSLRERLSEHPMVGDVRGEGLLAAVEFVAAREPHRLFEPGLKVGARVAAALAERGVIARAMPQGDILGFAPPLVLDETNADTIVRETRAAVEQIYAEL